MKTSSIAVLSPSFSSSKQLVQELSGLAQRIVLNQDGETLTDERLFDFVNKSGAEIVIVGRELINESFCEACKKVKLIVKYGVGLDNVNQRLLAERGIILGWTPGVNKRSVSELTLAFMLGHLRNVFVSSTRMKAGLWIKNGGLQLSGRKIGIVGLGHIGTDLAELLQPFACAISFCDRVDRSEIAKKMHIKQVSYREILQNSEVITFHVPGDKENAGMLGEEQLDLVDHSTLIINTSRGEIVDFNAVIHRIEQKKLGGYAADVFEKEPYSGESLSHLDNVYLTPHIGGNSQEAILSMGRSSISHIKSFLRRAKVN